MYIDFETTQEMLLYEDTDVLRRRHDNPDSDGIRIHTSTDRVSNVNIFKTRPQGIIIQDTYNNFAMPIRPKPRIDTAKFDLLEVMLRYREKYTDFNPMLLPWHFCVELVQDRYFIMNTRPISFKYPLTNQTIRENIDPNLWTDETQVFFDENILDVSESIHICLVGDSTLDVYPNKLYNLLGRVCINPLFGHLRVIRASSQNIFSLNMGQRFNTSMLVRFARR